jgi:hypothetical protein
VRENHIKCGTDDRVNLQEASNQMIQNYGHQYDPNIPESASFDDEPAVEPEPQQISETAVQPVSGELFQTLLFCINRCFFVINSHNKFDKIAMFEKSFCRSSSLQSEYVTIGSGRYWNSFSSAFSWFG